VKLSRNKEIVSNILNVPSGTGSYNRQAGSLADEIWVRIGILKACCRLKYSIFYFV